MNPHNVAIYACEACGMIMVIGCIGMLCAGVISLTAAANSGNISLEIADKVKFSTTYPALALFFFGLLFALAGVWFSQGDIVLPVDPLNQPIEVVGDIRGVDDPNLISVTLEADAFGSPITCTVDGKGQLDKIVTDIKQLTVTVNANGYIPQGGYKETLNIDAAIPGKTSRRLSLSGPVTLTKDPDILPPVLNQPGQIAPIPAGTQLAPLRQ